MKAGTKLNVADGATSVQPEVQVGETCPEGFGDQMGHTLWYKITGTGAPVTFDTAGATSTPSSGCSSATARTSPSSRATTTCFYQPVGSTYQAAITFDTVTGQTYYVEVGGWTVFDPDNPEFGLLKLKIS